MLPVNALVIASAVGWLWWPESVLAGGREFYSEKFSPFWAIALTRCTNPEKLSATHKCSEGWGTCLKFLS